MEKSVAQKVSDWLIRLEIPIGKSYFENKLVSHPNYPSLLSITDTLDTMGIENAALQVDKESLTELPTPFLAAMNIEGTDFILVKDAAKLITKQQNFLEQWPGIVIVAEKPEFLDDPTNQTAWIKEKRTVFITRVAGGILIALVLAALSVGFNWWNVSLMVTTLVGGIIAALIVQHEMGINNHLVDKLCSSFKNSDCEAVLQSKPSTLFSWLNMADMAIIWFASLFFIFITSLFTSAVVGMLPVLAVCSGISVPLTAFSLYYQGRS
jgi:hypothetical protein